jgi:LuxR family quorum sensing-dependent transcriptional regulator
LEPRIGVPTESVRGDLTSARSVAELESIGTDFAQSIGCRYFSYVVSRPPRGGVVCRNPFIASYAGEWKARYLARRYQFYDPVVTVSKKTRVPFFWGQRGFLRPFEKAERYVFHEAAEFGILEGYAVPVVGPDLDAAVFSVVVDSRNGISDIVEEKIGELQIFATRFHDAAVRFEGSEAAAADIALSTREKEVLTWTAEGYSSEAVATRLGLSTSAVNYHVTNCCRKLGAGNKIHAVALAIRMNLM